MNFNSSDGFTLSVHQTTNTYILNSAEGNKNYKQKNRAGILIQFMSKGTAQLIA